MLKVGHWEFLFQGGRWAIYTFFFSNFLKLVNIGCKRKALKGIESCGKLPNFSSLLFQLPMWLNVVSTQLHRLLNKETACKLQNEMIYDYFLAAWNLE